MIEKNEINKNLEKDKEQLIKQNKELENIKQKLENEDKENKETINKLNDEVSQKKVALANITFENDVIITLTGGEEEVFAGTGIRMGGIPR